MRPWSIVLALSLLLSPLSVSSAVSGDWGPSVDSVTAPLAGGAVLSANTYWTGGEMRTENYVVLEPGGALKPAAASHEALFSTAGMDETAAEWEKRGLHVVAGINGGFYSVSDRAPVGAVIGDGVLRSFGGEALEAVGFRAGGGAVIGDPGIALTLRAGDESLSGLALNCRRREAVTLFTPGECARTLASGDGWNVFCAFDRTVPMRGTVRLTVDRVEAAEGSVELPPDRMVLSLAGDTAAAPPEWLGALASGAELRLEVSCAPGWEDVESGVCLLYPLLRSGRVVEELEERAEPRSAIGLRADGGLVLYTVDGRNPGHSVGAGLDAVARRMAELGCVSAGALDGGGSTQLRAVLPGETELAVINAPSDGSDRKVVNYIFLTTDSVPTRKAAALALYPLDIDAVPGAEVPLTVRAIDANGWPAPVPDGLEFSVSDGLGTVENGVFRASGDGSGSVTVSAPWTLSAAIPLTVAASPDELALYGEVYGRRTASLTLERRQEVDLTVRAAANHVSLSASDECFHWSMDSDVAAVDDTGHLTPLRPGTGTLTVSAGEAAVSIPITILGLPFEDVPEDSPRYDAIQYVYDHGLFAGTGETSFSPDAVMDRAMLVTVLWRMEGEPEADSPAGYADVAAESWYAPGVAWAAETGLVRGYSDSAFGPEDGLTKEQILTILHRYAGAPEPQSDRSGDYPDADRTSAWAGNAMRWALEPEREIVIVEDGLLRPAALMSRADVAETLMRYLLSVQSYTRER